jgi:glucokinase
MATVYMGVDIGGTSTTAGLFDEHRRLLAKTTFSTLGNDAQYFGDPESFMDLLTLELTALTGHSRMQDIVAGVGIGVPGMVDPDRGFVGEATNLGWKDVALAKGMRMRMHVPVRIDHDVRTFAWGEVMAGAAKGYKNAICLTIGTGVAAGILIDGKLVRGAHHCAGEIGHDSIAGLATACPCGKTGCLETVVSASGIVRLAMERGLTPRTASRPLTAYDVYRYGAEGDPTAIGIFHYVAQLLAGKLETAIALLDPEIIVIGGGVSEAGELLFTPLTEILFRQFPWLEGKLRVVKNALGDEAALIGALYHVYP